MRAGNKADDEVYGGCVEDMGPGRKGVLMIRKVMAC